MEYTIKEISNLANISTRTLPYYDQISLLSPSYINDSNYRIYTSLEVDLLQQILFFKELGMPLNDISLIVNSNDFDKLNALEKHHAKLQEKQKKTTILLKNINKTITHIKGEIDMNDEEKFIGLKEKVIYENDKKYGKELVDNYGKEVIEESYNKYRKLSKHQVKEQEMLANKINELLIQAVKSEDPSSEVSMQLCKSHQLWTKTYWPTYSKKAHMDLVEMYLEDERFKKYYEKTIIGGTMFLRDAMRIFI